MPDGSNSPLRLTLLVEQKMQSPRYTRAALAWLADRGRPGFTPDPGGVALHLALFARDGAYWARLCEVFRLLGMSDR